jgi:replicative DNA helicase
MAANRIGGDGANLRLPPQNLEAEKCVLGSLLLQNNALDEIADFLRPDHFYNDAGRIVYDVMLKMHEAGIRGIDAVTLAEELDRRKLLAEVGSVLFLNELLEAVPHAAHVKYYANIVREKWVLRRLTEVCTDVLRVCYSGGDDTGETLQMAERGIFEILEQQTVGQKISMEDILIDAFDRIDARVARGGQISGLSTGFLDLDHQTNGFQPSELVILAARPSMGKTALVCNIAQAVAQESQTGVLVFSLEQSKLELAERFLSIQGRIDGHRMRKGQIDDAERHALMEASSVLSKLPIFIDDRPGRTVAQIGAIARRLRRRDKIGLIVIDYLQLIEADDRNISREQQIAQITRRLKGIAKEADVPLIALSQLNRGVELREDKRPRLADLRESGAIEQDADIVMFLHRPDAYDPEDRPGLAEIIVAKHRSGPTGIVNLTWKKEHMRFLDYSAAHAPAAFQ